MRPSSPDRRGRARDRLTWGQAHRAAKAFILGVTSPERPWGLRTAAAYLPAGYRLEEGVEHVDFFPVTITNVARVFRRYAVKEDR